jgi:hypothetical protein
VFKEQGAGGDSKTASELLYSQTLSLKGLKQQLNTFFPPYFKVFPFVLSLAARSARNISAAPRERNMMNVPVASKGKGPIGGAKRIASSTISIRMTCERGGLRGL